MCARFKQKGWSSIKGVEHAYVRLTKRVKTLISHYLRACKASKVPKWCLDIIRLEDGLDGGDRMASIPSQQDPKPQPTPEAQPNASSSSSAAPPKPILKRKAPKVTFEEEAPPQKKMKIPAFEFPVSKFNWHTEDKPSLGDIFGHDFGEQAPSTPFHLEAEVEAELDAEHTDDILVLDSEQEHTEPTPEPTPEIIYEKVDKKTAGFDTRRGAWWKADYGIRQYATEFKTEGNTVFAVFRNTQKNKTHLVPVPGLDASELEVFENGIQAKYKHTPAGEQKKHEVLFQGAFRHTHTHTHTHRNSVVRPIARPKGRCRGILFLFILILNVLTGEVRPTAGLLLIYLDSNFHRGRVGEHGAWAMHGTRPCIQGVFGKDRILCSSKTDAVTTRCPSAVLFFTRNVDKKSDILHISSDLPNAEHMIVPCFAKSSRGGEGGEGAGRGALGHASAHP